MSDSKNNTVEIPVDKDIIFIRIITRKDEKNFRLINKNHEPTDKFVRRNLLTILDEKKYYIISKNLYYKNFNFYPVYFITEYNQPFNFE